MTATEIDRYAQLTDHADLPGGYIQPDRTDDDTDTIPDVVEVIAS